MKKIFGLIIITIISLTSAWGQINTLYFNKNIYQSTDLNPARQHNCKFTLGLPAISSLYLDLKHTGFSYADLFYEDATKPAEERFVLDIDGFYNTLGDNNYLFLHNKTNIFNVAFWVRDFYITFDANLNMQQNFTYPKSLFAIKDGNYFTDDRFISLTGFAEDLNIYTSYSIGVSKEVIPGLTVGGKLKLLKGIANVTTEDFQLDWHVSTADADIYDYTFDSKFDIRFAAPFPIEPEYDEDGNLAGVIMDSDAYMDELSSNPTGQLKSLLLSENTGFAVDLGVIYQINKKFEFSASILDLGFINWQTNPMIISTDQSSFVFSGFDLGKYINNISLATSISDPVIRDSIINLVKQDFTDTLITLSNPTFEGNSYKSNLNTKINGGFAYMPADWVTLGFLYNGYLYHKKLISSYTLSGTLMFWRGWSYTLSYTMFKQSFNNVGMGISYKIGPFQTYILTNNISLPTLGARYGISPEKPYDKGIATKWVKNTQTLNLQFGINFIFGCRERKDYGVID
ncbi:MAG: hypothetical protein JXL97_13275 [Bacteroidales bacterium]|nr:hypothetical protein [Bacteroidales bacterium]